MKNVKIIAAMFLPFAVISYTTYRFHVRGLNYEIYAWEEKIRAREEPVTLEELQAFYPPVSNDKNAALIYLDAIEVLEGVDSEAEIQSDIFLGLTALVDADVYPAELRVRIETYLSICEPVFDLLDRAYFLEHSRYPIKVNGPLTSLDHLVGLKQCARLLYIRSGLAVRIHDQEDFLYCQRRMFHIAQSLQYEPDSVSQSERQRIYRIAVDGLVSALNSEEYSIDVLRNLENLYDSMVFLDPLPRLIAAERCWAVNSAQWETYPFTSDKVGDPDFISAPRKKLGVYEAYECIWTEVRVASWPKRFDVFSISSLHQMSSVDFDGNPDVRRAVLKYSIPGYRDLTLRTTCVIAELRCARAALAIELYWREHGRLPLSLREVLPEEMRSAFQDPFSGEFLRYLRKQNGYGIYSVYEDRDDDGGRPVPPRRKAGKDWRSLNLRDGDWQLLVMR